MKKIIMTLAIAMSTLGAFAGTAFGNPTHAKTEGEENISPKVLQAFKSEFNTAKEVEWTAGSNYYKAAFMYNNKHVFAYYNTEGELIGLTRYISPVDLPLSLQSSLKKIYADYWISDLFEVAKNDGTGYYITLENADSKIILEASDGSEWNVYQKIRKA